MSATTKAARHTPGPWFWERSEHDTRHHSVQLAPDSGCRWEGDDYMRVGGICTEADARLIAAAPDMYEALQAIATGGSRRGMQAAACAALAKAEGGAA